MSAAKLLNRVVQVVVNGEILCWGIAEYLTPGGWVGIRQQGRRLDEFPGQYVELDPT